MRVLIPVNELSRAKGRLAEILGPADRSRLAIATVHTVVNAVRAAACEPVVLTRDPAVKAELGPLAAILAEDPAVQGLNAQLESAIARLGSAGPLDELAILHADLPLASEAGIRALLASALPAPSVALVESPDGGTNAMLLHPPGRFPLAYGPGSFALHVQAARAVGMAVARVEVPALALDLDTPGDIARLMATEGGPGSAAGRVLAALGFGTTVPGP